jgi:hypothetical protein
MEEAYKKALKDLEDARADLRNEKKTNIDLIKLV